MVGEPGSEERAIVRAEDQQRLVQAARGVCKEEAAAPRLRIGPSHIAVQVSCSLSMAGTPGESLIGGGWDRPLVHGVDPVLICGSAVGRASLATAMQDPSPHSSILDLRGGCSWDHLWRGFMQEERRTHGFCVWQLCVCGAQS